MKQNTILVSLILTVLVLAPIVSHYAFASKADILAKKRIMKGLEKFAGGPSHWSRYCTTSGTLKDNQTKTVYDKPCLIIPKPPINETGNNQTTPPIINETTPPVVNETIPPIINETIPPVVNETVPPVVNETNPPVVNETAPPTNQTNPTNHTFTKIDFTGDVSGTAVLNALVKEEPDLVVVAGDLGYQSTLAWFKTNYEGDLGEELKCTIGNHDAEEDGSSSLYKEALAYCKDHWSIKINNSTLVIGLNTNDGAGSIAFVSSTLDQNPGIKNLFVTSHKNGHVPPNSHHPAEASSLYSQIESIVPQGIRLFEVNAHNHVMASAPSHDWFISGAGGKSHYTCGTDSTTWTFCNNSLYGYLQFMVNNSNATVTSDFYDTSGKVIR